MGLREKSCLVSLRKASDGIEDDDPLDDFLWAIVLVILEEV